MVEEKRDFALSFLYAALNDAQSTIRAIDFKAAAGIAVLGAMLGKILEREQLAAIRSAHWPGIVCACFFGVAAVVSATLAFKAIFPMLNPAQNVTFPENLRPAFFLA